MMCPKCEYPRMKSWEELTGDEKFIAERLPLSATFSLKERECHLFCPRCRHEEINPTAANC
ncbi:MAG: hypothetical protein M3T96_07500 [Acidobacteriota bacterium]|nr:hypothetical protein [Acidobacteriota bacterium]